MSAEYWLKPEALTGNRNFYHELWVAKTKIHVLVLA